MNKLLKRSLILSCILYLASCILFSYPPGWSDDILINQDTTGHQQRPDIGTGSQNNVWISWDVVTWTEGEIYYSKRDSLGNCLIPETTISNNTSRSSMARIAVDTSDNVQFIWRDETPQGIGIWHAKLANDGSVIVPSHLAVAGAGGGLSSLLPEMTLNKYQNVNIIWDEAPSGYYNQMDYTKLDSLGDTIISKIQVSPVGTYTYWPGIGIDSFMNSHLGYRSDSSTVERLAYTKLDKDGNILISNQILDTGGLPNIIADRSQNIHIVYCDPTGPGIRVEYLKLDQNGNILISPQTISTPEINNNTYAHMAIDSLQFLHVVWQGDSSTIVHIMYCKLDTMGNYVIPPMKIVYPYQGIEPRIAVDCSNRLHVIWVDGRLNPGVSTDIFYKRGENVGIEEIAQLKASNLAKLSVFPNPFTKAIKISFSKEHPNRITHSSYGTGSVEGMELKIYDASGRSVRQFDYLTIRLSDHIIWTGTDDIGNHLPAGVYFIRLSNFIDAQSMPVILLR